MSGSKNRDVIIIGGGPAGLSCAIWLKKLGLAPAVLEASDRLGGLQMRSPYENLWIPGVQGRTGQEVAASLAAHAEALSVELRVSTPALWVSEDGLAVQTDAGFLFAPYLVLATGSTPRAGGFRPAPNVAIGPGVAMEALEVRGCKVAILGGGDNAFDQARFVRDRGGQVTIFSRKAPRAQKLLQNMITDVRVVIGDYTADQVGMTVNGELFDAFGVMYGFEAVVPEGLELRRLDGYIDVDRFGATSVPGVYACGEVTNYWHPCVTTAAAHGVQVAKQISLALAR
ncbi:Thioredoxin reductase [Asticcacaulis sp. MM231]|uniref:NAD(P)/FAD-dependent oxidoreductase n=1 Tax=Asticcacaulis sp. MM231 TaxID=3157666 RepID=UPI0032D59A63